MIVIERQLKIKEILLQERSVKVADLALKFEVSEETIRRDLNQLEKEGLVKKNYGGAILVEELLNIMDVIPPVQQRKMQFLKEKDLIGQQAAQLVREDQVVLLDAGSTTWNVAKYFKDLSRLTIVTNSIDVAEECIQNEEMAVILIGGKLVKKSMSLVGPQAGNELQKYNADIVFLGTSGISLGKGLMSSDLYEAEVKRAFVAAGQKVVVVADHSKFNKQGFISFCSFEDVDILITSDLVNETTLKEIEAKGVEVIVCNTGEKTEASDGEISRRLDR